jgi:organic hydroperoxide reductase OsmC/OhrA
VWPGVLTGYRMEAAMPGGCAWLGPNEFQDRAEQAKSSCIISRALGGVGQINLSATLAS